MSLEIQIKPVEINDALKKATEYEHNLVRQISSVRIDAPMEQIIWEEVEEAFFFDEKQELHIYRSGEELIAVEAAEEEPAQHIVKKCYEINKSLFSDSEKKKIVVKEYLDFDEDGQCFVGYTRLSGIVKGEENGK